MGRGITAAMAVALMTMTGCASARLVEARDGHSYGEADARRGGGHVEFVYEGIPSVVAARRADAYSKMRAHCGGAFCIASESISVRGADGVGVGSGTAVGGVIVATVASSDVKFREVDFRCTPDETIDARQCR
jgi:hypothetical protein